MLRQFLQWLESGEKTADDLLIVCLRRIAEREIEVRAWVEVCAQAALGDGPLSGIPFGVKDIFETRGMSTAYGWPLLEGRKGEYDSVTVNDLRRAGAVLLGKTQTTAFASFDPAPTRNPKLPGHTPGGSSSGSAAAVADGMVPFAVGTQTLGSVLRPASYCGICGFKPSFGLVPIEGALPFAPSLDTIGLFTQTAADMKELWWRGFGGRFAGELHSAVRLLVPAGAEMEAAMDDCCARLRAERIAVKWAPPPEGWVELEAGARAINRYEGARMHRERYQQFGGKLGTRLAELIRAGLAMPREEYDAARAHVERMRAEMTSLLWEYPVILTPAASGPAPRGLEATGDPGPNAPWTALGMPAISVPLPVEDAPLGLQIAGAWGRDDALIAVATELEAVLRGA